MNPYKFLQSNMYCFLLITSIQAPEGRTYLTPTTLSRQHDETDENHEVLTANLAYGVICKAITRFVAFQKGCSSSVGLPKLKQLKKP